MTLAPTSATISPRRLSRLAAVLALATCLLAGGCSLFGNDTYGTDGVTGTITGDDLVIENQRDEEIWAFAIGRSTQAATTWVTAVGEKGTGLAPGHTKRIPLDQIAGGSDEDINVHWWEAVVEDGERTAGPVTTFTVER